MGSRFSASHGIAGTRGRRLATQLQARALGWLAALICVNSISTAADRVESPGRHAAGHAASSSRPSKGKPFHVSGVWVLTGTFMDRQDGKDVAAPGRASEESDAALPMYLQAPVFKGEYE